MTNLCFLRFPRRLTSLCNPVKIGKNILWRYNSSISPEDHVFVVGAPRSGTTLMFSILASHPAFSSINSETFFFVPRDVLNQKNYDRLYHYGGLEQDTVTELLSSSKNLVDFYDSFTHVLKQRDDKKRFVEKTPFHALYLRFLTYHFPHAKFINMIRDGRDCYVSNNRLDLDPHFHKCIVKFSQTWRDFIKARNSLLKSKQIIDIRYEELTQNPGQTIEKVMSFIDEDFLETQIDHNYFSKTKMFSGQGGHERLDQPIKPSSIGQWKEKMSEEEIDIFHNIAGRELQTLGYNLT